jgi:predicted TIM-barrel fold metal-dependent hydrolase
MELIESNPETKFTILHLGPNADEFAVAAASNSNVYIDFGWSLTGYPGPSGFKRLLSEWLEIMPWEKFMVSADTDFVELVYGTVLTFRELISEVLAEKVQNRFIDIDTAIEIGRGILRDNAKKLYNI